MNYNRTLIALGVWLSVAALFLWATPVTQAGPTGGVVNTCDDATLTAALSGGGLVTFNCGPATLTVTSYKTIANNTTIDGSNNGNPLTLTAASGIWLFYINAGKALTLTNVTIANTNNGTSAIYNSGGQLDISHSHFYTNQGGAIYSNGPTTVTQSVFSGATSNAALLMGPLFPLSVSNSQFFSNTAGAISAQGPTTIDNSQIDYNMTPVNNGAVDMRYSTGGPLTITNSSFISNSGGAIVSYGGNTYINSTNFMSNTITNGYGPALWFQNSSPSDAVQVLNSTFQGNVGGAISTNATNGTFNIANTQFIDNSGGDGAADIRYMSGVTITNSSFVGNSSTYNNWPGALTLTTPAWISGTSFIDNMGPQGGAFYMSANQQPLSVYITNTQFLTNTSTTYDGGAIRAYSGNLNLSDVTVSNNRTLGSGAYGGGIWADDPTGMVNIDHSLFYSNTASTTGQGGAMYLYGSASIVNTTIYSNSAYYGGGIYAAHGVTLTNVTLANNTASGANVGGNLQVTGLTPGAMVNTIVAGGSPKNCVGNPTSLGYNISSDSSCVFTGTQDLNSTNPLLGPFQNNGGSTNTLMPTALSPAVNAGSNAHCPTDDQRGVARPVAGICDIGAVESPFTTVLRHLYLPLILR